MSVSQMRAANSELTDGQVLYCHVDNTNWDGWGILFNWYYHTGEGGWAGNDNGTEITTNYWYATVPNAYIRWVEFGRCKNDFSEGPWNYTNKIEVSSRSDNYQNCVEITGSNYDGATVSWTTYRPAMSSASVVDNGTTKTGSGTLLSPYQVVTGTTIYLSASGVSAVEDGAMTKEYKFFNNGSLLRDYSSTNTYSFEAGAAGTTYQITVKAKNTYQSDSGAESGASSTLYYTVIAEPETTHEVTISYKFGETTIEDDDTEDVGEESSSSISAPDISGYTFSSWSLGSGLNNESGSTSANPISITTKSSGTYTLTANYTEDLSSPWTLKGGTNLTGDNWATEHALTKKTGHSTESVAYYTFSISSTNSGISGSADAWSFKLINSDYYGLSAEGSYWWQRNTSANRSLNTSGANIQVCADVTGDYEVKVDYSTPASPTVTVTFPTSYTLTYAIGDVKGNDGSISSSPSTSSGSYVASGSTVTLTAPNAATGYTWKGWYGAANGSGDQLCSTKAYAITVSANTTVYACYTENEYNVTVSDDGNGSVSPTGTVAVKQVTGTSLTASPSSYYVFKDWTIADGGITPTTSSTNPQTFKATETGGTIRANFKPQWTITGGDSENGDNGADAMGNWDVDANGIVNLGTNASSKDTGFVNITLPANTTFYFKVRELGTSNWYGNTGEMTYGNHTGWTMDKDQSKNCRITTAGAGTYKFIWNITDKKLTVVYPTSYTVTFGYGTGGSAVTATVEDATTITSGKYATAGKDVTFTQTPATGYTFKGWYTTSDGNTTVTGMGTSDNVLDDIAANASVYAQYTEDMHDVTLVAGSHGSITTPASGSPRTVSAGISSSASIAATADDGYVFSRWRVTSGDKSNVTIADSTAASTTITATGDGVTITALFISAWAITGSSATFGEWSTTAHGFSNFGTNDSDKDTCWIEFDLPANSNFTFKIYNHLGTGDKWYGNSTESTNYMTYADNNDQEWEFHEGNSYKDCGITTAGKGTYRFIWNITDEKLRVRFPESHTVSYDVYTFLGDDESSSASTTGGSISSVVDGDDIALTSGKYIIDDGVVTFTHSAASTNYHFDGWYSDATCETEYVDGEGGADIDDEAGTLALTVSADATVYAKFAENMTTVNFAGEHGHVEISGSLVTSATAGTVTTRSITAVPDEGYYFSGWTKTEGDDYNVAGLLEENATTTLSGLGGGATSGQTLTANFQPLNKIYFRNVFDDGSTVTHWSDVYVYFGISWEDGTGRAITNSNAAYKAHMTQIKGKDVWWAYVPRAFTNAIGDGEGKVAFSDESMTTSYKFYNETASGTKAATRGDYKNWLNMFVPYHEAKTTNNAGVDYFDNGYWMKYDTRASQGAGYYLKKYNSRNNYTQEGEFIATNDDATYIQFRLRIDRANTDLDYMITSASGINYLASAEVTSSTCTDIVLNEDLHSLSDYDVKFTIHTTSEGDYTFIINQNGDKMKLSVDYPVSVGDYRLKHTYNDGSAKTTYSDVIKASNAAEGQTISMYLSTAGSETLVLQKCTDIVAGQPSWNEGDATNLAGVLTTVGKNYGVYQFDVAVSADKVASAPTATKYTGPYYIKTDGASGGWANYKQNYMDENTVNFDTDVPEKSFNYYFCKYYNSAGQNLKCVIANDYCNALTDTLIGDDILGLDGESKPIQSTTEASSVRFSYNSYTNEIKRAYLGATTDPAFLLIEGAATDEASHIYTAGGTKKASIKFEDRQNWRYEIDVKADVNARAKLTAHFNSKTQYFLGAEGDFSNANTVQLFGGEGENRYGLTLVYDFKTNKLIRAWRPTEESVINEDLTLESDVILLREHQSAPTPITFDTKEESEEYASLKKVETVYSVLRFNRWILSNRQNPTDLEAEHCKHADSIAKYHAPLESGLKTTHERELYFISFPYDVKMSDIIHFGGYYDTWGIMYYDGKGRAKNGYWVDSESNWKYFTPEEYATDTLKAYEGYLVGIDLAAMDYDKTSFWTNNSSVVDIYFPSIEPVSTITQKSVTVNIDTTGYQCTINRDYGGEDGDRRIKDSHWHCIGVPTYADLSHDINNGEPKDPEWKNKGLLYLYAWNTETNEHSIEKASSFSFQSMYAYLVQYAGTELEWSAAAATSPTSVAAKRIKNEELRDREFNLYLLQGDKELDNTYIRLSDDEAVTAGFEFNHDVSKMMLKDASLYTLIGKEQAAANSLPLDMEHTTVVPVGVKLAADGTYTFAIPEGTEGIGVTLIDKETGARTQLGALDYTVDLTAGTYDERFALEISPIHQTPTGIDNTDDNPNDNFRKVMVDGVLYIIREGQIFDARGARVK